MLEFLLRYRVAIRSRIPSPIYGVARDLLWKNGVIRLARRVSQDSEAPPPHLTAQYGVSDSIRYLEIGRQKAAAITEALGERMPPPGARVLDFGCGAGRVMEVFAERYEVYGCDTKAEAIDWLRVHRSWRVELTNTMPPLPSSFSGFSLIYALSVLTHMPEDVASAWLAHLPERLAPGGVVLLTVLDSAQDQFMNGFGLDVEDTDFFYDRHKNVTFLTEEWMRRRSPLEVLSYGPVEGFRQYVAILVSPGAATDMV